MLEGLWLVHPDDAMCAAFRERFAALPNVRVVRGRFEDLELHDCFVTAGNAFGLMTAGIDAAVVRRFGESLMRNRSAQPCLLRRLGCLFCVLPGSEGRIDGTYGERGVSTFLEEADRGAAPQRVVSPGVL